jgi:hypothetical protein
MAGIGISRVLRLVAGGAVVAVAASLTVVLAGPVASRATTTDGDVVLGFDQSSSSCTPGTNINCESDLTSITNTTSGSGAIRGISNSGIAVLGFDPSGTGVRGQSSTGTGVVGLSDSGIAVLAQGSTDGVLATGGVGVSAEGNSLGVQGKEFTTTGTGVEADATGGGTALRVDGPALFSRSGTVVIPSGSKTATVTTPGGLTSSALVLALMQNTAGGVMVKAAVPNPGAGTFKIVLNKAPLSPATATVAWFVVN